MASVKKQASLEVDEPEKKQESEEEKEICGIIMPISAIDGCPESHWIEVQQIISESIEIAGFTPNLVSYADDIGIIQKRIIQNIYENPIVVCDVSGKNPNVMFELGMRLAFDKPAIIIKDDKTSYSFDTAPIEHLEYPRDLRFTKIVEFKEELSEKINATYEKSKSDKNFTTFLKHFGTFKVAKIDTEEVTKEDYIIEELKNLRTSISSLTKQKIITKNETLFSLCLRNAKEGDTDKLMNVIEDSGINIKPIIQPKTINHYHLAFASDLEISDRKLIMDSVKKMYPEMNVRWWKGQPIS